ncbi:LysR family transcriptional regulator [Thorsellia anophelis]|uniref:DNA-binding transcriptional regulator, LysR family n=1 Tax=Thorsellia anophelis DSM 18579 TaxID=1123402 RepID=A0A1I0ERI1_9GAMM|nr:LysR family transcriptional regulator [Thorsellia anophelis]SET47935.1 DNA-binding transcriptional regulator, LysR family [Thorsellia anophelis DSM 18579]
MSKKPQLSLEALRIIDAIDRFGSFAAAANHLHKVPSAITYSVQKLEEELDTMIFDRSGYKTQFTKAGLFLLEQGRLILDTADELGETVQSIASGWESQLTIVCEVVYASHMLYPFVHKLNEVSKTQLTIQTEVLSGAFEALRSGRADVLIAVDSPEHDVIELNKKKIKTLDVVYVANPEHPIFSEQNPSDEITREKFQSVVIADTASHYTTLTRHVLPKQPRLVVSSLYEKRLALLQGLGVATMPFYFIKDDINSGRLKIIGSQEQSIQRDLMMFWRRDNMGKAKTLALKLLPEIVKQSLSE